MLYLNFENAGISGGDSNRHEMTLEQLVSEIDTNQEIVDGNLEKFSRNNQRIREATANTLKDIEEIAARLGKSDKHKDLIDQPSLEKVRSGTESAVATLSELERLVEEKGREVREKFGRLKEHGRHDLAGGYRMTLNFMSDVQVFLNKVEETQRSAAEDQNTTIKLISKVREALDRG